MRPHLRQIEGVNTVGLRLLVGHNLHIERPGGVVATLDSLAQVAAVEVSILARHFVGLSLGEELVALLGLEVVLDPEALAFGVNPLVGVRAEAVHVAQGAGQAAVAHQPGDLVRRCGVQAPEIPLHIVIAQTRTGHTLLRVDKVGELNGIANEEDRSVVAYQVVVAFGGVEFHRETAWVTPSIGGTGLARHGRETNQQLGFNARLKERRTGVLRNIFGGFKVAVCAGSLRVHHTLGNTLTVELGELFNGVSIVQNDGAISPNGEGMVV